MGIGNMVVRVATTETEGSWLRGTRERARVHRLTCASAQLHKVRAPCVVCTLLYQDAIDLHKRAIQVLGCGWSEHGK